MRRRSAGPDLQSFLTPPGETLVAPDMLTDLDLPEGATPPTSDGTPLPPLRAQAQLVPGVLVVDIGIAQRLLNRPDQISRLLIGKTKGKRAPLESIAGDQLRLVQPDAESDLERLTDSFHLNLTAFGLLSFVVGLFIVNSAIGLAFEQRLPMLRTLRACGVSARMLNSVLVVELVSLALAAGLVGLVCGYLIAAALLPDVAASLRGLYGAQIPGQLTLKPEWWLAGIVIAVAGALAAATTSLAKAIRLPVLAAAQPYAWQQAQHRWLILQSALALAVLAAAGLFLRYGDSLVSGFAVLAALLLGAALILPAILERVLSFGQRQADGALAGWFWADSRQQLSGLSLALMALLLALAVNVGVGTMVETFSRTFVTWLDGRLAADVYVNASDAAQAAEIRAWLRGRPEVAAILPGGRAEVQIGGSADRNPGHAPITPPIGITGHCSKRTPYAWRRLLPGDAALVSEQLARRLKLGIGDSIEIPAPGGNWKLEIVGIYADYGNPEGPGRRQYRGVHPPLPRRAADANGPAGLARGNTGADLGPAAEIRSRRPQFDGSGHAEGRVDADLQQDVCGDGGVERVHARRRRHRALDEPVDPEQFPPAAARAVMGHRHHAAAAGGDRAFENPVGGADHHPAGAAARIVGGVVPDRGGECEGVRLAAAVPCLPAAIAAAIGAWRWRLRCWPRCCRWSSWRACSRRA